MFSQQFVPLGFTSQSSTGLITPAIPAGTTDMLISVATNAVNYRDDGTAPTAAAGGGVQLPVTGSGIPLFQYSGNVNAILFIPVTGTAVINILYYKRVGG